ncbi:iron complex outermembrane receptor protein [Pseudoxanthomonas japonensis]|uniref:TonB-dependent receptor n=1 Tax=Pseudoxanthomonas japonensis TaxID=69284 RepID=UPI00286711D8|nr:TonB-dependent receptor [Pseudoxanthomonas japonensis]MDR7068463.1 iron complex outermembrane receptor protein [Pseudoxanthomonas japonensis]
MKYRTSILSASIAAGLAFSMQVSAQEATSSPQATDLDTVVVTGIRGSIEKALDAKRDAATHVEVVTAEDVGKLPAKNVADTLRQLPGVNIASSSASEGGFDEADRVSLRGTNPSLTQTLVNGHTIGTGDWFVLSQVGNVGRSVSYSLYPSEIVDRVVVHKTSEAKLVEGGTAGSVNIITRRPLQFAEPLTIQGSIGAVYSDLPGETKPQLDALLNWRNEERTAGFMVQVFNEERSLRRDGQEVVGGYGTITSTNPDLNGVLYPNLIGAALFEQVRKRQGGVANIEAKVTDNLTLNVNAFYSKLKADNYNRNYMMWASQFVNSRTPSSYTVQNGVLTSATYDPVTGGETVTPYGVYDMISRPGAVSTSKYIALDAEWNASDALKFVFQLGTTKGNGSSPTQDVLETGIAGNAGASWRMNGVSNPIDWSLGGTNTATNHLPQNGWIFGAQGINVLDKEDWASADGQFFFDGDTLSSLDFGYRYAMHERKNDFSLAQGPNWATNWTDISAYPAAGGFYPGDFGVGGSVPSGIWYYTPGQLAEINSRFANRNNPERFYFSDVYGVKEDINAFYTQLNFRGERWSGNAGLRYVRTRTDVNYNQALAVNSGIPGAITGSAFGDYLPVVVNNDYNELLPSVNFKFELTDALVARMSGSKTMTRPDFSALAGSLTLNDLTHEGSGGNPNLDPLVSTNFDASLEWYFAPRALLAASVFSMNMDGYVDFGNVIVQYKDQQASQAAGTDVYSDYLVSIPVNSNGKARGVELTYEQPIGENFGINANYTYVDGKADGGKPLNGTSENTYNFSAWYENARFNARVNYSYRSSFYAGVSRADNFYQDDFATVSASLGFKATDWLTISLDALNLNDPKLKYYTENDAVPGYLPHAFYSNGRQYYLNFRFKF